MKSVIKNIRLQGKYYIDKGKLRGLEGGVSEGLLDTLDFIFLPTHQRFATYADVVMFQLWKEKY